MRSCTILVQFLTEGTASCRTPLDRFSNSPSPHYSLLITTELRAMRRYPLSMELSGPTAMWTRPDTGDVSVSYPAPLRSSATRHISQVCCMTWERIVVHSMTKGILAMTPNQTSRIMSERFEDWFACQPLLKAECAVDRRSHLLGATPVFALDCRQPSSESQRCREAGPPVRRESRNRARVVQAEWSARQREVPGSHVLNDWSRERSW